MKEIEIDNLDEIAIGVAKFLNRYYQYPEICDYTFREAYNRSFYLQHIEISEDLVLSIKKKIKEVGLDTPHQEFVPIHNANGSEGW